MGHLIYHHMFRVGGGGSVYTPEGMEAGEGVPAMEKEGGQQEGDPHVISTQPQKSIPREAGRLE